MRWITLCAAVVSASAFSTWSLPAQQSLAVKGVTYIGAELIKEYPQSVYIRHANGKTFVNKADLHRYQALELGVSVPPPPAAPPPAQTPRSTHRVGAPRATPHPSSLAAAQQEFRDFIERGSPPQSAKPETRSEGNLPDEPYVGGMDPSSKRLELFEKGFLPLTRMEAMSLFSGKGPSDTADALVRQAFTAARYLLGQISSDELSSAYRRHQSPASRTRANSAASPNILAHNMKDEQKRAASLAQAASATLAKYAPPAGYPNRLFMGWDTNGNPVIAIPSGLGHVIRSPSGGMVPLIPTHGGFLLRNEQGGFEFKSTYP